MRLKPINLAGSRIAFGVRDDIGLSARLIGIVAPILIALFAFIGAAVAAAPLPALTGRIVDQANVLPPLVEADLAQLSQQHETKTGDQLVVVTVKSLDGEAIEDFGVRLGRAWKIGQADKDNGVILIVAPNDRDVRIEVGYGLEGDLPDAITRLIIESSMLPRFRAGDVPGGVERGFEDIVAVLDGDAAAYKDLAQKRIQEDEGVGILPFLFILAIFLFIMVAGGGRGSSYYGPRGSSGGGWSGGGGGGGFSGGGGSFGGGGASGRW